MFERIASWCVTWAVGHGSAAQCDTLGMSAAQRLAADRAWRGFGSRQIRIASSSTASGTSFRRGTSIRLVKGDARCLSIAAASILAKVTRDRIMQPGAPELSRLRLRAEQGLPCPRHKAPLRGVRPCAIHRRSWVFMDNLPWTGVHAFSPRACRKSSLSSRPARMLVRLGLMAPLGPLNTELPRDEERHEGGHVRARGLARWD